MKEFIFSIKDIIWATLEIGISLTVVIVSLHYIIYETKQLKNEETNPELVEDDIEALNDKDTIKDEEEGKRAEDQYTHKGVIIGMVVACVLNVGLKYICKIDTSSVIVLFGIAIGYIVGRYMDKRH